MTALKPLNKRLDGEEGVVVVIFALVLVVLFAAVAFAVDLSRLYHQRQVLQNAVDFGALAGAQDLPVQGTAQASTAAAEALKVTLANAPEIAPSQVAISFRCIVGDRDGNGAPDVEDIPAVCGPVSGTWPAAEWRTKRGRSSHACNPYAGDKCNTILVGTSEIVDYAFAPVIGINSGSTGVLNAASCKGACGAASAPLDVVLVLDRTGSMTPADIVNVKNAAISILGFYDSSQQHVGLVALPYGPASNKCTTSDPQRYPDSNYIDWQQVPMSSTFTRADGTLDPNSTIARAVNCLQRTGSPTIFVNGRDQTSKGHTNLGDPLDAARDMLRLQGRPDVPDIIIFETDGQANQPYGLNPCNYLNTKASIAKAAGQTIYTIAYGLDSPPVKCDYDTGGPFVNKYATYNLAMAATNSTDDVPGGCGPNENKDGDNYFCVPGSTDLEPVFRQVAAASVGAARLVDDV
jgi:Putative Flp pilus-assembly TadE/G-like